MNRTLLVGIILIVSGIIIFSTMVLTVELEQSKIGSNEMRPIPYLAVYNASAALVGIPTSLVGIAFVIKSYISRLNMLYTISLSAALVAGWILFIFSRGS